jgi:hypothetical protein
VLCVRRGVLFRLVDALRPPVVRLRLLALVELERFADPLLRDREPELRVVFLVESAMPRSS